ncbi:MAG TPA: hypothetical protein VIY73_24665 [Polyangiaceae bacterium]
MSALHFAGCVGEVMRAKENEMPPQCCDDPGCPYCGEDAQVCGSCGALLFGWEYDPCDACTYGTDDEDDELQTPHQPG